ncbi:MAG: putative S-layer protein, partial [Eubacterium sp.]|nr:putative S-layer protein [Eubacterium sp.]
MIFHIVNKQNKNGYIRYLKRLSFLLVLTILLQSFVIVNAANGEAMSELTVTVISKNQVKLKWTDNYSDEIKYTVEKRIDNGSFTQITRSRDSKEYTDYSVNSEHTYTYRIKVTDSTNTTYVYTDEVTFNTGDVQKPSSLKVTSVSSEQIDLKWSYPNDKAYTTVVMRREANDTEWYKIATVPAGQFTFSDNNVQSGVTYYYKIHSILSENVKSSSFPDEDRGYGSSPLLYKPTDLYGFAKSQYSIQIEWSDSYNAATYVIQRKSPDQSAFKNIAVVPNSVNVYVDINDSASPVVPNTVYTYRIQAISGSS